MHNRESTVVDKVKPNQQRYKRKASSSKQVNAENMRENIYERNANE